MRASGPSSGQGLEGVGLVQGKKSRTCYVVSLLEFLLVSSQDLVAVGAQRTCGSGLRIPSKDLPLEANQ